MGTRFWIHYISVFSILEYDACLAPSFVSPARFCMPLIVDSLNPNSMPKAMHPSPAAIRFKIVVLVSKEITFLFAFFLPWLTFRVYVKSFYLADLALCSVQVNFFYVFVKTNKTKHETSRQLSE